MKSVKYNSARSSQRVGGGTTDGVLAVSGTIEKMRPIPLSREVSELLSDNRTQIRELQAENNRLKRELRRMAIYRSMAYRDALTGLYNRRYFDERLQEECARSLRVDAYPFGVILIDVDDFKEINDTYGHPVGDMALCAVAEHLLENIREVDICCRFGGDEFAVLLPATDTNGCHQLIKRLRATPIARRDLPTSIGLSIGGATCPPGPSSPNALLDQADIQMYDDKRQRKNS